MTEVGAVIQPGEAIPEDVTEVRDRANDGWRLFEDGWRIVIYHGEPCEDSSPGLKPDFLVERWGPLTVTAVRPLSAASESPRRELDTTGEWYPMGSLPGDEVCCGMVAVHTRACPCFTWSGLRSAINDDSAAPGESESGDLLDLVRQHGEANLLLGERTAGHDELSAAAESAAVLFARIEAEVNRLRDKQTWLHRELLAITEQRDSWIEQHRQRGVEIEKFKAGADSYRQQRDEALAGSDDFVNRLQIGIPESWDGEESGEWIVEQYVREIERRLLAAGGSLEKYLYPFRPVGPRDGSPGVWCDECGEDESDPRHSGIGDSSAPLVLSLPSAPDGATALIVQASDDGGDIRFQRTAGGWHRGPNDVRGVWSLLDILQMWPSARVVMREPRTELPCGHLIESNRFENYSGEWVLITVPPQTQEYGPTTTPLVWCTEGHGWVSLTAEEWAEIGKADGPLVEVFDEDGTR